MRSDIPYSCSVLIRGARAVCDWTAGELSKSACGHVSSVFKWGVVLVLGFIAFIIFGKWRWRRYNYGNQMKVSGESSELVFDSRALWYGWRIERATFTNVLSPQLYFPNKTHRLEIWIGACARVLREIGVIALYGQYSDVLLSPVRFLGLWRNIITRIRAMQKCPAIIFYAYFFFLFKLFRRKVKAHSHLVPVAQFKRAFKRGNYFSD